MLLLSERLKKALVFAKRRMVKKNKLKECTKRLLGFFAEQDIFSFKDLERIVNRSYCFGDESIDVSYRPSEGNSLVIDVSYVIKGAGVIIGVKINPELGYTKFIVKAKETVDGYMPFFNDNYGNIAQMKDISFVDIGIVKGELEKLLSV